MKTPQSRAPVAGDEDAIILEMAKAHDREESAQKGEPSPWDERFEREYDWEQERFFAMREAFDVAKAVLSRPASEQSVEQKDPIKVAESRGVGIGMAIAAGMVAADDDVKASEILHAINLTTEQALRDAGVDDYDIEKLAFVLKCIAERKDD